MAARKSRPLLVECVPSKAVQSFHAFTFLRLTYLIEGNSATRQLIDSVGFLLVVATARAAVAESYLQRGKRRLMLSMQRMTTNLWGSVPLDLLAFAGLNDA